MTVVRKNALVPYTSAQMFALVDDVESYQKFLPWCVSSAEIRRTEDEVEASIELAKGRIRKSFTTLNRIQKDKMIEIRLVDGPFKHLEGFWRFDSLDEGRACKVSLDLEFEFSSRLLGITLGPVFHTITNTLVDAFVARARDVHG
jgi:ribosome-associated toxin RatA of RatAB toxin-antitoxin module